MNHEHAKKLLPELVIAAVAIIGLWSLLVSPMRERLGQAQAAHANAIEHARIAGDPELSTLRLNAVMDKLDNAIGDIERRSGVARDQTALQARLMEIGAESRIRIDRVSPAKTRSIRDGDFDDRIVSFEIEFSGLYRDITGFVAAVEDNFGLTRIDRFSIRPNGSEVGAAVRAKLRTTHFAFDTSPPPNDDSVDMPGGAH